MRTCAAKWRWPLTLALALISSLPASARAENLDLVNGQQKLLQLPGVSRIAIANPNVADVKVVDAGEVLVTAVGAGQTELTVWQGSRVTKYVVTVTAMDPQQLKREVERQLGETDGIRVRINRDNSLTLEGTVNTLAELERAEQVSKAFPQVKNSVRLDPSATGHIAEAINRQLDRAGLKSARANVVGSTIFLEGVVDSVADVKKAELITRAIGDNVQTMLSVGSARMVELDVEFVEVSTSSFDRIGIKWPTDISAAITLDYNSTTVLRGQGADSSILRARATAGASFGIALQFNDGITRTLAQPRLVTASGKEAKFLAGGEVPIPVVTDERIYVEYKEYGIRLQITPIADGAGTIQAKILTEISDLDPSTTVQGFPGFTTRRVDTEVTVRDGEVIVLSGLLHTQEGKDVTKVPFFGHIPIIGELFKSRQFRERQTELVVFVTPRVVDPMGKYLIELVKKMRRKYEEAEDDVGFSLLD